MKIVYLFLTFIIFSFIGWLIEIPVTFIREKKIINRGFLIGPYCPIYGIGGILAIICLEHFYNNPIALFILAVVLFGSLEYFTSYVMEKTFNARWWDYSDFKYNINGRVCLETLIPFGLLGCFVIYVCNPLFKYFFDIFSFKVLLVIYIVILTLFITDIIVSLIIVNNFKKRATKFLKSDNTEEINQSVKVYIDEITNLLNTRLVKAFPNVKKYLNELKESLNKKYELKTKKTIFNKIKKVFKKKN